MEDVRNNFISDEENTEKNVETETEKIQEAETTAELEESGIVSNEGSEQEVSESIDAVSEVENTESEEETSLVEDTESEEKTEETTSEQEEVVAEPVEETSAEITEEEKEVSDQEKTVSEETLNTKSENGFSKFVKGILASIGIISNNKETKAAENTTSELEAKVFEALSDGATAEDNSAENETEATAVEEKAEEVTETAEEAVEETAEEETSAEETVEEAAEEETTEETSEETAEEVVEEESTEEVVEETSEEETVEESVEEETVEEPVEEETAEENTEEAVEEETTEEVTEETSGEETVEETVEEAAEENTEEAVEEETTEEVTEETSGEETVEETVEEETAEENVEEAAAEETTEEVDLKADTTETSQEPSDKAQEKKEGRFSKFIQGFLAAVGLGAAKETVAAEEIAPVENKVAEEVIAEESAAEETTETEAETTEEVSEETAEEVVEESNEEVTEDTTSEDVVEEAAEETSAEKTSEETTDADSTEEATEDVSEDEVVEAATEEVTNETAEEEPTEEVTEDTSEEETADDISEEITEEITEETSDETAVEETTEETSEETAAEKTTEEITEEASEETSEETTEEAEAPANGETEEQLAPEGLAAIAAAPVLSEAAQAKAAKKQAKAEKLQAKYDKYRAKAERKAAKKAAQSTGTKVVKGFFKTIGIILLVIVSLLIVAASFGVGTILGVATTAPEMEVKDVYPTMYPTTVLDSDGNQIARLTTDGSNRAELTADEITDHVRYAVIDIEDERFYEHNGIDPRGIIRAVKTNLSSDRSEGASTITQQLIKNAVFEGGMEDNLRDQVIRKIREWKLALDLEKKMSKEEILVTYLNTINMGSGVYGIKEAARFYYNKELPDLTISECAVLAGITQNPSANNPFRHPETNRERQLRVLNKMLDFGHITQAEYDEAVDDIAVYDRIKEVVSAKEGTAVYSYFTDSLLKQVLKDMQEQLGYSEEEAEKMLYAGGLTIHATQNPTVQKIVDEEMNDPANFAYTVTSYSIIWNMSVQKADGATENYDQNMLSAYHRETLGQTWYKMDYWSTADADAAINEYKNVVLDEGDTILTESVLYPIQPQVSFSVMDYTTGQVLAVNGGRGEKTANLTLSRATDTFRQPGSTFKPLASFGPAIDMGRASLETPIVDEPFTYPYSGKQVRNWWGESYRGTATVREGIRNSMNVVAVKNLNRIGPENVIPYLQKMGFSTITEQDANLATALGGLTYGVSNLELCAAYAMIANKGVYIEPSFYTTILDYEGNVLLERKPRTEQVFQEYTCTLLTQALQDVVTSGTGTGCAIWTAPVAGKTGTTNDNRDIWFAGFIPNRLCSCIWVGQDDNATLWNANLHQAIYSKTMRRIVEALGLEGGTFPGPGQEIKCICKDTGMLATENCPNTEIRFYDFGFGPGALCTAHPLTGKVDGSDESTTTKKKDENKPKPTQAETTTTAAPETTPSPETVPPETVPPETVPTETTPSTETQPTEASKTD